MLVLFSWHKSVTNQRKHESYLSNLVVCESHPDVNETELGRYSRYSSLLELYLQINTKRGVSDYFL